MNKSCHHIMFELKVMKAIEVLKCQQLQLANVFSVEMRAIDMASGD